MTPLEKLTEEVAAILASGSGPERKRRLIVLAAREYAAAQVEAHARPGPWPLRKPNRSQHPQGQHPKQRREAS